MAQSILQFVSLDSTTSASSISKAFPLPLTPGSTILVLTYTNFTSMAATPVLDTLGSAFTPIQTAQSTAGPGNQSFRMYASYNTAGGADTVTVQYASATTICTILLLEVVNSSASPLDGSNHNDQTAPGTGVGAVLSGSASNTNQPALAIGFSIPIFQTVPPAAVSPYTSAGTFWSVTGATGICESRSLTATGSQQATFTTTLGSTEHLSLFIILDAVAGGTSPFTPFTQTHFFATETVNQQ